MGRRLSPEFTQDITATGNRGSTVRAVTLGRPRSGTIQGVVPPLLPGGVPGEDVFAPPSGACSTPTGSSRRSMPFWRADQIE